MFSPLLGRGPSGLVLSWAAAFLRAQSAPDERLQAINEALPAGWSARPRALAQPRDHLLFALLPRAAQPRAPLLRREPPCQLARVRQDRILAQPAMRGRTRPTILLGRCDHPAPHRIALDVSHGRPEVLLVQRAGEEPSLPQPSADVARPVDVLGVTHVHRLQGRSERPLLVRDGYEVHVVGHEAVRLDGHAVLGGVVSQKLEVAQAISLGEEDILAAIAALREMMRTTRNDHASHARHTGRLSFPNQAVNTKHG